MNTQFYTESPAGAALILLEGAQIRLYDLTRRSSWLIGRPDPGRALPDIEATSSLVSREHGWIKLMDDQWFYVDNPKNTNGTYRNGRKIPRPVYGMRQPVPLDDGDILRIDNEAYTSPGSITMLFTTTLIQGGWRIYPLAGRSSTLIGRSKSCQISLSSPYLSGTHAKITLLGGEYYLSDCGSKAGTFVNGQRVTTPVRLWEKDCISICDSRFFFLGDKLLYTVQNRKT